MYNLSDTDFALLIKSFANITILVAGADGNIDSDELDWAKKVTEIRTFAGKESLQELYSHVTQKYASQLKDILKSNNPSALINSDLVALNDVLAKIDQKNSFEIYSDLLSFAKHVAKASGGFLGFGTVSKAEKDLISLSMIKKIENPNED